MKEKKITAIIDFVKGYLPRFLWVDDTVDDLYIAYKNNNINLLATYTANNTLYDIMKNKNLWNKFINYIDNYYRI